jgi:ABC-2 type transport system ATP-binding protein
MYALKIENVSKSFYNFVLDQEKVVLKNCDLNVKEESIFGLVGLNGIGKTTLIKIMFDMLDADSGSVYFFDSLNKDFKSRRKVCYLPEKFQPSQYLTGYDFLEISLSFFNKTLDKKFAQETAERIDLDPSALSLKSGKYSKGMGQKLGLIACFLSGAKLLVLDEPMSGLDPRSRIMLKDTLMEYKKAGNCVFFSSHILEDITEICDDIAVLHSGAMKFRGTAEQLKLQYKSQNPEKAFLNCIESNL